MGQFATWGLNNNGHENVKGLLVRGFSMEPEIKEGDVIFVDPDTRPDAGNIVLGYMDEELVLTRFTKKSQAGEQYQFYGTVVGINRKLA